MSSQDILWINIGIGALIALIFMLRSSQKEPSRLRLSGSKNSSQTPVPASRVPIDRKSASRVRTHKESVSDATVEAASAEARIKSLNVIFNYNGHSWDAYEVLGVPAGAPPAMVKQAFEQALKANDPASHEFLKAALYAIERRK